MIAIENTGERLDEAEAERLGHLDVCECGHERRDHAHHLGRTLCLHGSCCDCYCEVLQCLGRRMSA